MQVVLLFAIVFLTPLITSCSQDCSQSMSCHQSLTYNYNCSLEAMFLRGTLFLTLLTAVKHMYLP